MNNSFPNPFNGRQIKLQRYFNSFFAPVDVVYWGVQMTSFAHQVKNELVRKPLVTAVVLLPAQGFGAGGRFVYIRKTVK